MPGGPIDPELIWQAIHDGATHSEDHLVTTAGDRWPRVVGQRWELKNSSPCAIDGPTFDAIRGSTPDYPYLLVGGLRYALIDRDDVAILAFSPPSSEGG